MIKENIDKIKLRIDLACSKIGKTPEQVALVAVTKNRAVNEIKEAIGCGLSKIGENRIQEALLKFNELNQIPGLKWHLIGHLQSNKAKEAVKMFDLIHSVDSLKLAQEINKQAAKINKVQQVLIEVNVSAEKSKFGVSPDEVLDLIKQISVLKNISIKGLMTVAPLVDNPEKVRPYFRILRELQDKINSLSTIDHRLSTLSMGMTDDFEVAIEEGADIIRLGRAIFA